MECLIQLEFQFFFMVNFAHGHCHTSDCWGLPLKEAGVFHANGQTLA